MKKFVAIIIAAVAALTTLTACAESADVRAEYEARLAELSRVYAELSCVAKEQPVSRVMSCDGSIESMEMQARQLEMMIAHAIRKVEGMRGGVDEMVDIEHIY